jgi:hypothetical protein
MQKSIRVVFSFVLVGALILLSDNTFAQCPMCRSAVESGLKTEGNTIGVGLNDGILYLLAAPYLMVAVVGGLWYRKYRKTQ